MWTSAALASVHVAVSVACRSCRSLAEARPHLVRVWCSLTELNVIAARMEPVLLLSVSPLSFVRLCQTPDLRRVRPHQAAPSVRVPARAAGAVRYSRAHVHQPTLCRTA